MFSIRVIEIEMPGAMPENLKQCKKCKVVSGDDWKQCGDRCPVEGSPHYDRATSDYYGPPRELTRDEYWAERDAKNEKISKELDEELKDVIPF